MTSLTSIDTRFKSAILGAGIELSLVEGSETRPDMQPGSSKYEEVEELVRAAVVIKGPLEVSLWEADCIENSANTV